jgi:hypothetical protein
MRVRPAVPGTVIRDPHTRRHIPDEGAKVPRNSYWLRRLRDGDVVLVEPAPPPTGLEPPTPLTTRDAAPHPFDQAEKPDRVREHEEAHEKAHEPAEDALFADRPPARKTHEAPERPEKKPVEFHSLERPEPKKKS